jgi:uncharacterized protein (TIGR03067 family)
MNGQAWAISSLQAKVAFTRTPATGNRVWVFAQLNGGAIAVHHQWAEYTLRPQAVPAEIDFRDRKGIYALTGDELMICLGGPKQPRPRGFRTVKGDDRLLLVARRKKP